jgi:hypothetical protein
MVQPDAAGVIPFGPVSWYGVARPCADSGFAGTMMLQLTLAAVVVVVVAVADGVALTLVPALAVGHGVVDAVAVGVAAVATLWLSWVRSLFSCVAALAVIAPASLLLVAILPWSKVTSCETWLDWTCPA